MPYNSLDPLDPTVLLSYNSLEPTVTPYLPLISLICKLELSYISPYCWSSIGYAVWCERKLTFLIWVGNNKMS